MRTSSSRLEMAIAAFKFAVMLRDNLFPNKFIATLDDNVLYFQAVNIADRLYPKIWGKNGYNNYDEEVQELRSGSSDHENKNTVR